MRITKRVAAGVAALSAAAMSAAVLTGAEGAGASTPHKVPVITVHMSSKHVRLSTGSAMHAGRVIFRVVTGKGDHALQIARLHKGYTLAEAGQDLNKAFGGDVQAIRRVDSHITFKGGAETRPNKPGRFSVTMYAGHWLFLDQESNAFTKVTVRGTPPLRAVVPSRGAITAYTYGFGTRSGGTDSDTLPADGNIRIGNVSDQPHFVVFQHVKASTTAAQVRRFFKHGAKGRPSWGLRASTSSGVISPYKGPEILHVNMPAGKYVIACFWPDDDTG